MITKDSYNYEKLHRFKEKFNWTKEDGNDEVFIEWWSRNHGTGYIEFDKKMFLKKDIF